MNQRTFQFFTTCPGDSFEWIWYFFVITLLGKFTLFIGINPHLWRYLIKNNLKKICMQLLLRSGCYPSPFIDNEFRRMKRNFWKEWDINSLWTPFLWIICCRPDRKISSSFRNYVPQKFRCQLLFRIFLSGKDSVWEILKANGPCWVDKQAYCRCMFAAEGNPSDGPVYLLRITKKKIKLLEGCSAILFQNQQTASHVRSFIENYSTLPLPEGTWIRK